MRSFWILLSAVCLVAAAPIKDAEDLIRGGKAEEAVTLLEKAAAAGDAESTNHLATLYDDGRGVAQDLVRAAALYRQAAERGNRHAQWRLGVMLDMSEGVGENPAEAVEWFRKAVAQGDRTAMSSLAVMYATGRGVAQDYTEAMRLYKLAAKHGEPHGFFGVAIMHLRGEGVQADPVESLAWMWVASMLGDKQAEKAMPKYGLTAAEMKAAADRANLISRSYGYPNLTARFVDCDGDKSAADDCAQREQLTSQNNPLP